MKGLNFVAAAEPIARKLFGEPNARLSKPNELRFGSNGSLSVNLANGTFFDFEAATGGGMLELVRQKLNLDQAGALRWIDESINVGRPKPNGHATQHSSRRIVATYPYEDERGVVLFEVVRFEPKDFRQRRPDGGGGWDWNLDGVRRIPYRLPELSEAIANDHVVFVVEGEKDVENLRKLNITATTCPGGAGKWRDEYNPTFREADVIVLTDNDEAGRDHARTVAKQLAGVAKRVRVLELPNLPTKGDVSDWIAAGGSAEQLWALVDAAPVFDAEATVEPDASKRLRPIDIGDFCRLKIKPREMVLGPIIPEKGIAMAYSPRGMGKTRLATGCATAVSTGTKFLKWSAPKPRRTLLIDGEMPAAALQELLNTTLRSAPSQPSQDMFQVLAADLLEAGGIGNLADPKVQQEVTALVTARQIEFLILDNLSSLTAVLRDNDEASWQSMKFWLLALRRQGISTLLLHHAGKGGDQRGTSAREDVLDTSISLRAPSDYRQEEGCRFEVHFTKHRGFFGADASPFEAQQHTTAFGFEWTVRDITDANQLRVAELLDEGMSVRDIAKELNLSKSAVHRFKKKIDETKNNGTPNADD